MSILMIVFTVCLSLLMIAGTSLTIFFFIAVIKETCEDMDIDLFKTKK